ncbi:MAG TPA: hypothetical protein VG206_06415 [Terriglobia bacterium]|nr:hypothetical protein [Terriglobia bacterium]
MSKEAEDAAKWQMFEKYKALKARRSALSDQAAEIGNKLQSLGTQLATGPSHLSARDEKVISLSRHTGDPGRVFCTAEEISFSKITSLLQDIDRTSTDLDAVESRLKAAGMEV